MKKSERPGESIPTESQQWDSSWPRSLDDNELRELWTYLHTRFGVPFELSRTFTLWKRGRTYWALRGEGRETLNLASLKVVSVGIPFLRRVRQRLKPTTVCLRLLSPWITKNRIHLNREEALGFLCQGQIPLPSGGSDGYVLVEIDEGVLGCGLLLRGKVLSQIPHHELAALSSVTTEKSYI